MGRESHNGRALALAQLAAGAADVIALSRWADNHRAASWRHCVGRGGRWQHHHHRARLVIGQRVSVSKIIGAQIDRETPLIRVADPCDAGRIAVVRIRETALTLVRGYQLA